ncbi:5682_t:CDS:2, partial [Acaulospora morrowiae]
TNNQEFHRCRAPERKFNACVLSALKLEKIIPDSPQGKPPIHLKENPLYS